MTRQERIKAFEMRLDGKSWVEIGQALGYAHSAVYGDLRLCILSQPKTVPFIYPNLAAAIQQNFDGSISAFAERCGTSYNAMYAMLTGRTSPKRLAQTVCAVTGLAYNAAFQQKEA